MKTFAKSLVPQARFQSCPHSPVPIDTHLSFEECVLSHQCLSDEPCPHLHVLGRAQSVLMTDSKLKALRRLL